MKTSVPSSEAFAGLEMDNLVEEVEKRYDYLWQNHSFPEKGENPETRRALRFSFESSALVFIPKENAWVPPSKCVWVESSVLIPEKASIAGIYPLKKTFFTKVLQVSEPTVEMYVEALKAEAKGKASAVYIKETMALICGLGFQENDLSSLVETKILPIKLAVPGFSASVMFQSALEDFVILDNTIHRDAFKGKIAALDFSLEEIRDTRPLLLAIGLEKKFSSKRVEEITDVKGGQMDLEMTKTFRTKSQAIVRYVMSLIVQGLI